MARSNGRPVTRRIDARTDDTEDVRTYLEITPAEASPTPADVRQSFERLHRLLQADDERGIFGRLKGSTEPTTLEWLIVSDGGECRPIRYLVGTTDDTPLDSLESTLRGVFPTVYEFDRVECHPGAFLATTDGGLTPQSNTSSPTAKPYVAGVEFIGEYDHPLDWQTQLTPYGGSTPTTGTRADTSRTQYRRGQSTPSRSTAGESPETPTLNGLLETMATAEFPMLYQVLFRPMPDLKADLDARRTRIEYGEDTAFDRLVKPIFEEEPIDPEDRRLSTTNQRRLAELDAKDARHAFEVTARAAVVAGAEYWDDPQPVHAAARSLANGLAPIGQTTTDVVGRVRRDETFHSETLPPGRQVLEAIVNRELAAAPPTDRWQYYLPGDDTQALVADPTEAPSFCLMDGDALPPSAHRAVGPRHSERTAIVPPPPATLQYFRGQGLYLGHVKDHDGNPETERLVLPPTDQNKHSLILGKSGSGKSVLGQIANIPNHEATDGATILVDNKGDGFVDEYLRMHYARYGDLEDVLIFDVSRVVPAFSILDIRPDLEAGRTRRSAVEDRANYFAEILSMLMTGEQYDEAKVSPHVLKFLVKAALDPVHGDDVVSFDDFQQLLDRLYHQREAPPTVYDGVTQGLSNIGANASTSFDDVMQGAAYRILSIQQQFQLFQMFNHAPADPDSETTPLFSFDELLDEDVVIVFDISGLRADGQGAFTGVVFAELWSALKRRAKREGRTVETTDLGFDDLASETATPTPTTDGGVDQHSASDTDGPNGDRPLVNLHIEEAADIAATDMVSEFLQQARGFDCGVSLSMQFPEQIKHANPAAYNELLNDVSTFITGNVGDDRRLARRFATDAMAPDEVANRLRALEKGEWMVSLPTPWEGSRTRPFLMESAPLQPGHPEGPDPLTGARDTAYRAALERCHRRTAEQYGLSVRRVAAQTPDDTDGTDSATSELAAADSPQQLQSALPYTNRLPEVVDYDGDANALVCAGCDSRYPATADGMEYAITCCNSRDVVDRNDVPICEVPLTLTAEECAATEYSIEQLLFLQAVYTAHLGRYDDLEYNIQHDSMLRLKEYLDLEAEAIEDLVDDGLLNHDGDNPHRLYTVTNAGLDLIQEQRREGITHGDGIGDLGESSAHRVMVLDAADWLRHAFVDNPDAPGKVVRIYYEVDGYRYDAVVLDGDGDIVVAVEAERTNNDLLEAVPEDYDKLAAADPEEAVWIVENRDGAHKVLQALNEPNDNVQRVEKTYSESTAPQLFTIDEPGLTDIHTIGHLRNDLLPDEQ